MYLVIKRDFLDRSVVSSDVTYVCVMQWTGLIVFHSWAHDLVTLAFSATNLSWIESCWLFC